MLVKTKLQDSNYFSLPGLRGDGIFTRQKLMTQNTVIDESCKYFGFTMEDLRQRSRKRPKVVARQVIMFLLSKHTEMTLKQIGELFFFDHTTVIHSCATIRDLLETSNQMYTDINRLELAMGYTK